MWNYFFFSLWMMRKTYEISDTISLGCSWNDQSLFFRRFERLFNSNEYRNEEKFGDWQFLE